MPTVIVEALKEFFDNATYPILFTGAGVSARAGLPTWKVLIEQLAGGLRGTDPLIAQVMIECLETDDYTRAVDHFKLSRKMLDGDKLKLLARIFSNYDITPILPIAELPFRGCLTTNFDRSILDAIANKKNKTARDYKFGDLSFKQAQWEEGLFTARIHGSVEMPETMVLSEAQFNALLKDEEYDNLLRSCFLHRNVLFVGFSFYDPAVRHVFEELNRRFGTASPGRHMALLPSDASPEFIQKATHLNVKAVKYDPANKHAALWDGINEFISDKQALTSPSLVSKRTPLESTKRYLAACYARAKMQDSSTA